VTTAVGNAPTLEPKVTQADLRKVFWRSFFLQCSFNYERMQSMGFAWAMMPVLTKLYKTKAQLSAALKRHLEFFNTTPAVSTFILGISASMEENNARLGDEGRPSSITAVKAATMGPLAGIGDAFFWGTFRVIAAGIGAAMAVKGNLLGVVLYVLLFNVPHLVVRYYGTFLGYRFGIRFLQEVRSSQVLQRITEGASILGMLVLGVMVGTMVAFSTPIAFSVGGAVVKVQEILDQILPSALPLGLTFLLYYLMAKRGSKPAAILLGLLLFGVVGTWLKIVG